MADTDIKRTPDSTFCYIADMAQQKTLIKRLTQPLLKKLRERKMTNAEAADLLGVSEPYLSRTVAALQEKEPGKTTAARRAASQLAVTRRQHREKLAKEVKNDKLDVDVAAQRANCSTRTMQRYVAAYIPARRKRKA